MGRILEFEEVNDRILEILDDAGYVETATMVGELHPNLIEIEATIYEGQGELVKAEITFQILAEEATSKRLTEEMHRRMF